MTDSELQARRDFTSSDEEINDENLVVDDTIPLIPDSELQARIRSSSISSTRGVNPLESYENPILDNTIQPISDLGLRIGSGSTSSKEKINYSYNTSEEFSVNSTNSDEVKSDYISSRKKVNYLGYDKLGSSNSSDGDIALLSKAYYKLSSLEAEAKSKETEKVLEENRKNPAKQTDQTNKKEAWSFFKPFFSNLKPSKPTETKVKSNYNDKPKSSIQLILVEPVMKNVRSVWYYMSCRSNDLEKQGEASLKEISSNLNRANKFKVMREVYRKSKASNDNEISLERVEQAFIEILAKVANENNLNKSQVLAIIESAKVRGGIFNAVNPDSGNYLSKNELKQYLFPEIESEFGRVPTLIAQKFSSDFQKECKAYGIYSGREGAESSGLRLTFIPDDVVNHIAQRKDTNFENIKNAPNERFTANIKKKVALIIKNSSVKSDPLVSR